MNQPPKQIPDEKLAWQVNEFCQAVGISRTSFYQLLKNKQLKTIRVGRRRLIPDQEARRFLSEGA